MTLTSLLLNLLPWAILALIIVWAVWSYDTVEEGELKVLCLFGNPWRVRQPGFAWRVFPIIFSYMTFEEEWVVDGDETMTRFKMAEIDENYASRYLYADPFDEAVSIEFGGRARPAFLTEELAIDESQSAMNQFDNNLVQFFRAWKRTNPVRMMHQALDSLAQTMVGTRTLQVVRQDAPSWTSDFDVANDNDQRRAVETILSRCLIYNGTVERVNIADHVRQPLEAEELAKIENRAATHRAKAVEKIDGAKVAAIVKNLPDGVTPDQVADTIKKTLGKGDWTEIVLDPRVIAAMGDAAPEILARLGFVKPKGK